MGSMRCSSTKPHGRRHEWSFIWPSPSSPPSSSSSFSPRRDSSEAPSGSRRELCLHLTSQSDVVRTDVKLTDTQVSPHIDSSIPTSNSSSNIRNSFTILSLPVQQNTQAQVLPSQDSVQYLMPRKWDAPR